MFEDLIKITRNRENLEHDSSEIIFPEVDGNIISVRAIKSQNIASLLRDLEELNMNLEGLVIKLYKDNSLGNLQKEYENVLLELRQKHSRIAYLSSFFETTRQKIEAVKLKINENETKMTEMEIRKRKIEDTLRKIKGNVETERKRTVSFSDPNPLLMCSWNQNNNRNAQEEVPNNNIQYQKVEVNVESSSESKNILDLISDSDEIDDDEVEEEEEEEEEGEDEEEYEDDEMDEELD